MCEGTAPKLKCMSNFDDFQSNDPLKVYLCIDNVLCGIISVTTEKIGKQETTFAIPLAEQLLSLKTSSYTN